MDNTGENKNITKIHDAIREIIERYLDYLALDTDPKMIVLQGSWRVVAVKTTHMAACKVRKAIISEKCE